jgi:hypothetical protein
MRIIDNGYVGIGQTSPTYNLDITGAGHLTSYLDASYFVATTTTATSTIAGGFSAASSLYVLQGGNVGIGTASPSQKLDVAGYVKGQSGLCIGNDCRSSWSSNTGPQGPPGPQGPAVPVSTGLYGICLIAHSSNPAVLQDAVTFVSWPAYPTYHRYYGQSCACAGGYTLIGFGGTSHLTNITGNPFYEGLEQYVYFCLKN